MKVCSTLAHHFHWAMLNPTGLKLKLKKSEFVWSLYIWLFGRTSAQIFAAMQEHFSSLLTSCLDGWATGIIMLSIMLSIIAGGNWLVVWVHGDTGSGCWLDGKRWGGGACGKLELVVNSEQLEPSKPNKDHTLWICDVCVICPLECTLLLAPSLPKPSVYLGF